MSRNTQRIPLSESPSRQHSKDFLVILFCDTGVNSLGFFSSKALVRLTLQVMRATCVVFKVYFQPSHVANKNLIFYCEGTHQTYYYYLSRACVLSFCSANDYYYYLLCHWIQLLLLYFPQGCSIYKANSRSWWHWGLGDSRRSVEQPAWHGSWRTASKVLGRLCALGTLQVGEPV